jgi:hypothetical protein
MPCSKCGEKGHNARTCSTDKKVLNTEERDRTLILRIDNMTEEEQNLMHDKLRNVKKKFTSNEAKATLVEGKSSELPSKIQAIINKSDNQLLPLNKKDDE